ncbi:uncharacterized protein Smp_201410 [Schistosoma mansoni]|uniref:uncharacterized protein n=1 Tax=Schistosoma mansoni TaxID=6183 RepID=UPI00022DC291|nr:uncharacterized protein Smp_201410 [Schistosoma mansoni]|eukprot:XP_018649783.1 uncharacterized protein Smp_201410 [Schistosoma mansoni]
MFLKLTMFLLCMTVLYDDVRAAAANDTNATTVEKGEDVKVDKPVKNVDEENDDDGDKDEDEEDDHMNKSAGKKNEKKTEDVKVVDEPVVDDVNITTK